MSEVKTEIEKVSQRLGVDFFGVADLTDMLANKFILKQGGENIAQFPRGVSLGIRLLDGVVDELYQHEEPSVIYSYRGLYNMVNSELDRAALSVSKKIQEMGSKAYPIPASQTFNDRRLEGIISHKLVAHMSGLGWIGKNCLLITPEHGPRVRLTTVLTDAQMETGTPLEESCGDCNECVEICPPRAFTGVAFDPSEPRDVRFRAHMCRNYTNQRRELLGEGICGLCVYTCPFGKS